MFSCTKCGGKVIYDIDQRKLRCIYCGSMYQMPEIGKDQVNNVESYETNVLVCKNCGAEVTTTDEDYKKNQVVSYCSYCGSQSVLFDHVQAKTAPSSILPFRISKKAMHQQYEQRLKGIWYLPKDFTDPKYIDSMRGIYMPYWSHHLQFPGNVSLKVNQHTELGGNQYRVSTYQASFHIDQTGSYLTDASSALDDTISNELIPFPEKEAVPFDPGYLAGFYADQPDVPAEKYIGYITEKAVEDGVNSIRGANGGYTIDNLASAKAQIRPAYTGYHTTLMPVWFLTRRQGNRVSYAVANGHDGKMHIDLPVVSGKYWLGTAAIAAIVFVLLSLIWSATAPQALGVSGLFTTVMLMIYHSEVYNLMAKEMHLFDIGHPNYDPRKAAANKKIGVKLGTIILFIGLVALPYFLDEPIDLLPIYTFVSLIYGTIQFVRCAKAASNTDEKSLVLVSLVSYVLLVVGVCIGIWNPVDDFWFYIGSALCLAGSILPGMTLIRCYNLQASSPLPDYFKREGGLNDAKDKV